MRPSFNTTYAQERYEALKKKRFSGYTRNCKRCDMPFRTNARHTSFCKACTKHHTHPTGPQNTAIRRALNKAAAMKIRFG